MTARSTKDHSVVAMNRKALRDFTVLERFEAGIELFGSEVKSIRESRINLTAGYCRANDGELFLCEVHISPYEHASVFNHDPVRRRRLLLKKREIDSLTARVEQDGLTLVPLKVYFKRGWLKVELGLCKGKRVRDKREALRERTVERETRRVTG